MNYLCSDKVGSISNGQDSISYGYDGSLVTSETLTGTLNQTLGYTYNNNFQIQSFSYAGGSQSYVYDNDRLLTTAGAFTITRDAQNGLPSSVIGQSLKLDRIFNGYGEIQGETSNVNGQTVSNWNLARNDNGQITTKQMTVNGVTSTFTYTYDPMGRLLTVTKDGTLVEEYRYGANGARSYEMNLLRGIPGRSYTYSSEDQVLTTGDCSYKYDVDGFLAIKISSGITTTYEYATRGELMKVTLPNGNVIEYVNDPLGRRIAKKINGVITEKYLWQGLSRLLAVYDGNDNLIERFIYADSRFPIAVQSAGNTFYLSYDQVGSLRTVSDSSGSILKTIDYDSFGNIISDSNPNIWIPISFAGGMPDSDTGLILFGARQYLPEIGRWAAKDPLLFSSGDTDLYGYCINDPINLIDPSGLDWLDVLANISAGFGDTITFGGTAWIRDMWNKNIWHASDPVNRCSASYKTGKVLGHLWQIGMAVAGGLSGGANSVFWSGGKEKMIEAAQYGTTIAKTPIGSILDALGPYVPNSVWNVASGIFARNATGTVLKVGIEAGKTWSTVELPILMSRGMQILQL